MLLFLAGEINKIQNVTANKFWLLFHAKENRVHSGTLTSVAAATQCIKDASWPPPLIATCR